MSTHKPFTKGDGTPGRLSHQECYDVEIIERVIYRTQAFARTAGEACRKAQEDFVGARDIKAPWSAETLNVLRVEATMVRKVKVTRKDEL